MSDPSLPGPAPQLPDFDPYPQPDPGSMQYYESAPYSPNLLPYAHSSIQPIYAPPVLVVAAPPHNGKAIASLVLGLGFALTACAFCIFSLAACVVGFGTGIPAVILGHLALKEIKASSGRQSGTEMAVTGLVLGYLSIASAVASCLFFVLFILLTTIPG